MLNWIRRGLATGILTTHYPKRPDQMPADYRGVVRVIDGRCVPGSEPACVAACLPGALSIVHGRLQLDASRCIQCGLCIDACPNGALLMTPDFEVAVRSRADLVTEVTGQ